MSEKNYKSKRRQRPRTSNKSSAAEALDRIKEVKETPNDWRWYVVKEQLASDVASFSFNTATGAPFSINPHASGVNTQVLSKRIPGVMGLWTIPGVGVSMDSTSPINIAAKNFYSFIRHENSGHSNYDSPDLMLYLVAMDSIFSWYANLTRAYGVARVFSQTNRYFGANLLQCLGFNSGEIYDHLNDLRAYINMLAVKMASFCVPSTMTYYKRHAWMYGNLFMDGPTAKAQLYAYIPHALYKYVEGAVGSTAGRLVLTDVHGSKNESNGLVPRASLTWQDIINVTEGLFQPLISSEDIAIMSGDVLKAYKDNVFRFDMIPEDYMVKPIYSEEILSQIHNTNYVGGYLLETSDGSTYGYGTAEVVQQTQVGAGNIICLPRFKGYNATCYDKILDMYKSDPTPEDVLVATRNMVIGRTTGTQSGAFTDIESCGSDMVLYNTICTTQAGGSILMQVYQHTAAPTTQEVYLTSYFNQAPLLYITDSSSSTANNRSNLLDVIGDIENYTVLTDQDLYALHQSALLSMFAVQVMGTAEK